MTKMTLDEVKNGALSAILCAIPVYFELDCEEHAYQASGSACLLRRRGHLFVVSAKHVMTNILGAPEPHRLRVPYTITGLVDRDQAFVSHSAVLSLRPHEEDELPEWADLLVAPLSQEHTDESLFYGDAPFDLDGAASFSKNGGILLRGFPSAMRHWDPDERQIRFAPLDLVGNSVPPFGGLEGLFSIEITTAYQLPSLDGISGGPVFRLTKEGIVFAGIVLRAGTNNAHALRSEVVLATLDAYLDGRDRASLSIRPLV